MSDLLTELRQHDLPPKWDGRVVAWQGWEYAPSGVFICPPPKADVCEGCRKPTTEKGFPCWSTNRGFVADSFRLTLDDFAAENEKRDRLPFLAKGKLARHWWIELTAFRCHHCNLDSVWDWTTNEWWLLDHTDYGDDGSSPPAPVPPEPVKSQAELIAAARAAIKTGPVQR